MLATLHRRFASSPDRLRRLLLGALAVALASLIAAGVAAAWYTSLSQAHGAAVAHTYEVEQAIAAYRVPLWRAEAARRGYIITPNSRVQQVYDSMAGELTPTLDRMDRLTADNPNQQRRIAQLRALTGRLTRMREQSIADVRAGRVTDAKRAEWIDESVPLLTRIGAINEAMNREEQILLAIRSARERDSIGIFYAILAVAGLLLLTVAALTTATVLRYTGDLTTSRDRLRDLADGLEDAVRERTADLIRANEEIQRFAYIVSHDLRSPLVNVLGFTSELETAAGTIGDFMGRVEQTHPALVPDEARVAAREDLPEAIGFIRSSTQKMDRLINAILKLAREGKRSIVAETIDLDAMLHDIAASLQHRLDTAGAVLRIGDALPSIVSDRIAVEQILSNLIENAVKYLDPARPGHIEVTGERGHGRVVIDVADNGRGIDPRDHQRIFDLFRRSGVQDQPGEGIGLAHVRALAYRLGGTIDVSSALGHGARFRLTLPLAFTE